eukprot:g42532.t1
MTIITIFLFQVKELLQDAQRDFSQLFAQDMREALTKSAAIRPPHHPSAYPCGFSDCVYCIARMRFESVLSSLSFDLQRAPSLTENQLQHQSSEVNMSAILGLVLTLTHGMFVSFSLVLSHGLLSEKHRWLNWSAVEDVCSWCREGPIMRLAGSVRAASNHYGKEACIVSLCGRM